VRGKSFKFKPKVLTVGSGLRQEVKLAVGENSIDVEDEDFDAAGAVFCG
jgi:hypothetical protein